MCILCTKTMIRARAYLLPFFSLLKRKSFNYISSVMRALSSRSRFPVSPIKRQKNHSFHPAMWRKHLFGRNVSPGTSNFRLFPTLAIFAFFGNPCFSKSNRSVTVNGQELFLRGSSVQGMKNVNQKTWKNIEKFHSNTFYIFRTMTAGQLTMRLDRCQ